MTRQGRAARRYSAACPTPAATGMTRGRRILPDGEHRYEYPQYLFSDESRDILGRRGAALDRLGVECRLARPSLLSVAKRKSVAGWMMSWGRSTGRQQTEMVPSGAFPGPAGGSGGAHLKTPRRWRLRCR